MTNESAGSVVSEPLIEGADKYWRKSLVIASLVLGIAAWVVWALLHYRAMHYVPDFPRHGDKIAVSPRANAVFQAFVYGEVVALIATLLGVIGLFMNRFSSAVVLACLPGPAFVAFPLVAVGASEFLRKW